jgi:hypothetical protein
MNVAVDCTFREDGTVRLRRVHLDGRWQAVEQGRQWGDENGRHVLIMLADGQVHEVMLSPVTLTWTLHTTSSRPAPV